MKTETTWPSEADKTLIEIWWHDGPPIASEDGEAPYLKAISGEYEGAKEAFETLASHEQEEVEGLLTLGRGRYLFEVGETAEFGWVIGAMVAFEGTEVPSEA